jgi:hypothetical protein
MFYDQNSEGSNLDCFSMYPFHGWLARKFGGENGLNILSSFRVKDDFSGLVPFLAK